VIVNIETPEYYEIFREDGSATGTFKTRSEIHHQGLWHRTVHLWILSDPDTVLLQKRSHHKDSNPGLWDISAAGHVDKGESCLQALIREVREELRLEINPSELVLIGEIQKRSEYSKGFIDNEFQSIFILKGRYINPSSINANPNEISGIATLPISHLQSWATLEDSYLVEHDEEYRLIRQYFC
jgi:isopentenyldiphosphate isomerase